MISHFTTVDIIDIFPLSQKGSCSGLPGERSHTHICGGKDDSNHHLIRASQRAVGQQGPVVDGEGSLVDQDGSVLDLQDLDSVSHHRRHAELTQLDKKSEKRIVKNPNTKLPHAQARLLPVFIILYAL